MFRTRRRQVLLGLAVLLAGLAVFCHFLHDPNRLGPASFRQLREGMTFDEAKAILGEPRAGADEPFGYLLEEAWGTGRIAPQWRSREYRAWSGAVFQIEMDFDEAGRAVGAALLRRLDSPFTTWDMITMWIWNNLGVWL
jgi:hypothetical protein